MPAGVVDVAKVLLYNLEIINNKKSNHNRLLFLWPCQESNLDPELRKLIYYPLYYKANAANVKETT